MAKYNCGVNILANILKYHNHDDFMLSMAVHFNGLEITVNAMVINGYSKQEALKRVVKANMSL